MPATPKRIFIRGGAGIGVPDRLLLRSERSDRIYVGRAARGKKTGEERGGGKHQARSNQCERIARADSVENLRQHATNR